MTIPARYLPLVCRFRPQQEGEPDGQYLRAALDAAKELPLEAMERLLDELMEAEEDDSATSPDVNERRDVQKSAVEFFLGPLQFRAR